MIDDVIDVELERRLEAVIKEMIPKLVAGPDRLDALGMPTTLTAIESAPGSAVPSRGVRLVAVAAAVVALVGGLGLVATLRSDTDTVSPPVDAPPEATQLPATNSTAATPTTPSSTEPPQLNPGIIAPAPTTTPTGPASLVGAVLDTSIAPLVVVDEPGWQISYIHGTDDLPLGDTWTDQLVLVGEGPMFEASWFRAAARPAQGYDLNEFGDPIDLNGIGGRIEVEQVDPSTGVDGPVITLIWPLHDDQVAYVSSLRIDQAQTIAMAQQVNFDSTPTIEPVAGFTRLDTPTPADWLLFEYQYESEGRSLQLNGSNLGAGGLMSQIGTGARVNRTIGDVDVAVEYYESGEYRFDWLNDGWSFYSIGRGFADEDELVATLSRLRVADVDAFVEQAGDLQVITPGDDLRERVAQLTEGVSLPDGAAQIEWPPARVATSERDFAFGIYFGLACGWTTTWLQGSDSGDLDTQDAAASGIDTIAAKAAENPELPADLYQELANWMRAGDRQQVSDFGSNDCPTWSAALG